jgi:hypothetical protein
MSEPVFVLKVALSGDKDVWRRIAMLGSQALDELSWVIFCAFDRDDEHLYSFYFPKPGSKGRARIRDAAEYSHPACCEEGGLAFGSSPTDASEATLSSLGLKPRQKFHYLFDFGDEWWHDITVEAVDAPRERGKYPRILEKHGKSPPQYPDYDEDDE